MGGSIASQIGMMHEDDQTPQDKGVPSPVPYSLIIQHPSPDLNQDGVEKIYLTAAVTDVDKIIETLKPYFQSVGFESFLKAVFSSDLYRLEMVIGGLSIKIYKHPNNP
jgi:hypothetical protein